jgi:hypothetical protein
VKKVLRFLYGANVKNVVQLMIYYLIRINNF